MFEQGVKRLKDGDRNIFIAGIAAAALCVWVINLATDGMELGAWRDSLGIILGLLFLPVFLGAVFGITAVFVQLLDSIWPVRSSDDDKRD